MRVPVAVSLAVCLLHLSCASARAEEQPPVGVQLELGQTFYYEGGPLDVRVSVANPGSTTVDNPVKAPLFAGFVVRDGDDEVIAPGGKPSNPSPDRPARLEPRAFYGGVVDLTEIYPALAKPGAYDVHWASDGMVSDLFEIVVIERFDPQQKHRATVLTDRGPVIIELYADRAPIAVKAFVDMARAGFYDDLQFHEVHRDAFVIGGDPRFAPSPRRAVTYPAEPSSQQLVTGTVVMKPVSAAPPANASEFIILLKPQPAWTGQVTVLGQVVQGLEQIQEISRVPHTGQDERPSWKPLEPVPIRRVTIEERPAPRATAP